MNKLTRRNLIDNSIMVSDNMAMLYKSNSANNVHILVVNMKNTNARAIISIPELNIISSNMSKSMLTRAKAAVERNYELLLDEIKENDNEFKGIY